MTRAKITDDDQALVLLNSRRRCCICFGLNRNGGLMAGQIAHLDRNNENSKEDNLAFMCFEHHDEYDSKTSQRKGFTINEVKRMKSELLSFIKDALSIPVQFGNITVPSEDPRAGHYIRVGSDQDSAEIDVIPLPEAISPEPRYAISGYALWGARRKFGPNLGELGFVGYFDENEIVYTQTVSEDKKYQITIKFGINEIIVDEQQYVGVHGNGVTFSGLYKRVR